MTHQVITKHYSRRTLVIPASTSPCSDDISVRKSLRAPLQLSIHDYFVRDSSATGFTVILTHGTSFNKYFWELIISHLLSQPGARNIFKRFVALDAANHGDSALLNQSSLPRTACWPDDSRDILQALKVLDVGEPVIGIGHSFGGGAMCHAALMAPDAFLTTIFVEPILFQMKAQTEALARQTLKRRDRWASKADVETSFARSASLRDWDPHQVRVYIEFGTYPVDGDSPCSPRALKTPKEQEAATYLAAPYPEILDLLSRSKGRHHFVWGEQSRVISQPDRQSIRRMLQPPSTSQVVTGASHLIPMTHPATLASIISSILRDIPIPEATPSKRANL